MDEKVSKIRTRFLSRDFQKLRSFSNFLAIDPENFICVCFDYHSLFIRQDNNLERTKKIENKIMLPISGNILLYDMSISLHSERLRIIYDSSVIEIETSSANVESVANNGSCSNSAKTTM